MGPCDFKSPIIRLLTPTANSETFWALSGIRLHFPALPRPRISPQQRPFHTTNPCAAGSILDLGNLSISRESRFLARTQGRPRTQFSPHLDLIRSSEVDPFIERASKGEETAGTYGNGSETPGCLSGKPVSMANILEELAYTRAARESAERNLEELQSKITRRERESGVLVIITAFLFMGLVFRDQVRDTISKIMLGRAWAAVTLPAERDGAGSLNELGDPSRDHDSSVFTRDDAVASAAMEEHRYRSVVSRLLWASCV